MEFHIQDAEYYYATIVIAWKLFIFYKTAISTRASRNKPIETFNFLNCCE